MAKWPARTWTPGETNLDTFMNDIRDELNELHGQVAPTTSGVWVDVPFNAANFKTENTAVWTITAGNILLNRYTQIRKTVIWEFWSTGSTMVASPAHAYLFMTPPLPYAPGATMMNCRISEAYVDSVGYMSDVYGYCNGVILAILRDVAGTVWPAGTMALDFTFIYETL